MRAVRGSCGSGSRSIIRRQADPEVLELRRQLQVQRLKPPEGADEVTTLPFPEVWTGRCGRGGVEGEVWPISSPLDDVRLYVPDDEIPERRYLGGRRGRRGADATA